VNVPPTSTPSSVPLRGDELLGVLGLGEVLV